MVCTAGGSKGSDSSDPPAGFMAMGSERSKPLHNFSLPRLRWGGQRQMRCVKIDSPAGLLRSPSPARRPDPSPLRFVVGNEQGRTGDAVIPKLRIGGGSDIDGGIKAASEKLLINLRAELDHMRDKYFRQGVESVEAEEQGKEETGNPARPWNLRTRRSACKAPAGGPDEGKVRASHSPQRSEGENGNLSSVQKPALRSGAEKKREERPKFCPTLKRKEIEDDFLKMTGQRPPRKPKKRPRVVQKQLDMLLPGFWLTEVSADMYKVPEIPDNAKVAR